MNHTGHYISHEFTMKNLLQILVATLFLKVVMNPILIWTVVQGEEGLLLFSHVILGSGGGGGHRGNVICSVRSLEPAHALNACMYSPLTTC